MVIIREPTRKDNEQLAAMLCNDGELRRDLGFTDDAGKDYITANDFAQRNRLWCQSRNAVFYAIVIKRDVAVGTISLSHINDRERTARIGYWMGSDHWHHGYCSEAFRLVLDQAVARGLQKITASIEDSNAASIRIYESHGGCAIVQQARNRHTYEIRLGQYVKQRAARMTDTPDS